MDEAQIRIAAWIDGNNSSTVLDLSGLNLISLPSLPASLEILLCFNNTLTVLPPLPASLRVLMCSDNMLTVLPSLPAELKVLYCDCNQLTELVLPVSIHSLLCFGNKLPYCTLDDYRIYHAYRRVAKWWKLWHPGPRSRAHTRAAIIHDELVTVVAIR